MHLCCSSWDTSKVEEVNIAGESLQEEESSQNLGDFSEEEVSKASLNYIEGGCEYLSSHEGVYKQATVHHCSTQDRVLVHWGATPVGLRGLQHSEQAKEQGQETSKAIDVYGVLELQGSIHFVCELDLSATLAPAQGILQLGVVWILHEQWLCWALGGSGCTAIDESVQRTYEVVKENN